MTSLPLTSFIKTTLLEAPEVYHGTSGRFPDEELGTNEKGLGFNGLGMVSLGTHVGSSKQANEILQPSLKRASQFQRSEEAGTLVKPNRIFKLHTDTNNKFRMKDLASWHTSDVIKELLNKGIVFTPEEQTSLNSLTKNEDFDDIHWKSIKSFIKWVQTILISRGYDGIVYLNRAEGLSSADKRTKHLPSSRRDFNLSDEEFKKRYPSAHDSYILFNPLNK